MYHTKISGKSNKTRVKSGRFGMQSFIGFNVFVARFTCYMYF